MKYITDSISKEQIDTENKAAKCKAITDGITALGKLGSKTDDKEVELYKLLKGELESWKT